MSENRKDFNLDDDALVEIYKDFSDRELVELQTELIQRQLEHLLVIESYLSDIYGTVCENRDVHGNLREDKKDIEYVDKLNVLIDGSKSAGSELRRWKGKLPVVAVPLGKKTRNKNER